MPIEITDIDEGRGVLINASGTLTDDEFLDSFRRHLTQDPDKFKKYRYSLTDYNKVNKLEVSTDAIHCVSDLCRRAAKVNPEPLVAIVCEHDLLYGLARMWQQLMDEGLWETKIFRQDYEARSWLKKRAEEKWQMDCPLL